MTSRENPVVKFLMDNHDSDNIAEGMDDGELLKIGSQVVKEYKMDRDSRAEWEDTIKKSMDIAKQVISEKTRPWAGCANVKFPLMSFGAIQFAARTYPELVKDGRVVEAHVSGEDPDGSRTERAKRISSYMSYQLLMENEDWEADTDRLLHMLPIVGTVFRKSYYDPVSLRPCAELCDPDKVIIHNSVKSVETARRITHLIQMYDNDIRERIAMGIYLDIDLKAVNSINTEMGDKSDAQDEDRYREILEQHRYLDLDDDGYQEPYIVTVHLASQKVLRIVARYDLHGIKLNKSGKKIICIKPVCYFTDYHFIPSPDGSFYSMGFGTLLYPINESINSIFNQLLDAGTLSNLQTGFIGDSVRIQGGEISMAPGKWTKVGVMGQDIRDGIFPLPDKEPSQVLLSLLQLLISTGKDLTGVIDILPEDQQTQNVPATTILSMLDQRLKPLKAIFKRVYRSFKKEFDKQYRLNSIYLPDEKTYFTILNTKGAVAKQDFLEPDYEVKPIADPSMSSESQRIMKAQMLRTALNEPGGNMLNAKLIMSNWVKEIDIPTPDKYIQDPPPPPPNPEAQKVQIMAQQVQGQQQFDSAKLQSEAQNKSRELDIKEKELQIKAMEAQSNDKKHQAQSILDLVMAKQDEHNTHIDHMFKAMQIHLDKKSQETQHVQKHMELGIKANDSATRAMAQEQSDDNIPAAQ